MKGTLILLSALAVACASPSFPVRIEGIDLVRTGAEEKVLFRGVDASAGRPAADVVKPLALVVAKYRSVAAVVFTANHQDLVVVIDATAPADLVYSAALTVPMGSRAEFTPDGLSLVVSCERDLAYGRPENVGRLRVALMSLTWHEAVETALRAENRDDRWSRREVIAN